MIRIQTPKGNKEEEDDDRTKYLGVKRFDFKSKCELLINPLLLNWIGSNKINQ